MRGSGGGDSRFTLVLHASLAFCLHVDTCIDSWIVGRTDTRRYLGSSVESHLLIPLQIKNNLRQLSRALCRHTHAPQSTQPCLNPDLPTINLRNLVKHDKTNSNHAGSSTPNQASQSNFLLCFLRKNRTCAYHV